MKPLQEPNSTTSRPGRAAGDARMWASARFPREMRSSSRDSRLLVVMERRSERVRVFVWMADSKWDWTNSAWDMISFHLLQTDLPTNNVFTDNFERIFSTISTGRYSDIFVGFGV